MSAAKQKCLDALAAKGYTAEEAAAKYDELVAQVKQPENEALWKFASDTFEPNEIEGEAVHSLLGTVEAKGGQRQISSDPYQNDLTGKKAVATTGKSTTTTEEYARPILDEATNDLIKTMLSADAVQARTEATRNTAIKTLLLQRPNPSTYLKDAAGNPLQVVIDVDKDKMASYEQTLEQSPENIARFNEVKAAWQQKQPVDVYINDESNRRVVGVVINKAGDTKVLTISGLKGFLFTDVLGRIPGKPGVILNKWEEKRSMSKAGTVSKSVTTLSLKWAGRDAAIKDGQVDYITEICTPEKAAALGFDSAFESGRVRINNAFACSVLSTRTDKMVKRTKRLTGKCEKLPRFVLKDEFNGMFDEVRRKDYVDLPSTPDELNKALASIDLGLAAIAAGNFTPSGDMMSNPALNEMVTKIRKASTNTAGANDGI